jgi:multiple sugar transport system substrate-binding protein
MASGKYATWIAGAWAPGSIASTIPQTSGKWAAAPVPQWEADGKASSENGGSSNAVPVTSKNKAAAVAFAEWLNSDPTATKALADGGLFPATSALLKDPAFLDKKIAVLGDQQANQVYAASSAQVTPGWQYLPFQVYANSVFKDTTGQAISGRTDLSAGLAAWQKRITDYGTRQGFTVTGG